VNEQRICFVIGPIGEDGSEPRRNADILFHAIIEPSVAQIRPDITAIRADKIFDPGNINKQIVAYLLAAELVICDLTGSNANTFYEMAIRHAFARPCVHLYPKTERIPFDITTMRAVPYSLNDIEGSKARLLAAARAALRSDYIPDNPILDVLSDSAFSGKLYDLSISDWKKGRINLLVKMKWILEGVDPEKFRKQAVTLGSTLNLLTDILRSGCLHRDKLFAFLWHTRSDEPIYERLEKIAIDTRIILIEFKNEVDLDGYYCYFDVLFADQSAMDEFLRQAKDLGVSQSGTLADRLLEPSLFT
jgi:hypothetical protein